MSRTQKGNICTGKEERTEWGALHVETSMCKGTGKRSPESVKGGCWQAGRERCGGCGGDKGTGRGVGLD